nr:hypothetical protein [Gemmatimonadota bacterium]
TSPSAIFQFRWVAPEREQERAERVPLHDDQKRPGIEDDLPLLEEVLFSEKDVAWAEVQSEPEENEHRISLQLTEEATPRFARITEQGIGRRLAIVANGRVVMALVIRNAIGGGAIMINGFDQAEAESFVSAMRAANPAMAPPPSVEDNFGPVVERVVRSGGKEYLIDFESGRLLTPPPALDRTSTRAVQWLSDQGADAAGSTESYNSGLIGHEMIVHALPNSSWNSPLRVEALESGPFRSAMPGTRAYMSARGELPVTYAFKTREGGIGILQIVGFEEGEPGGVKVRYRMARSVSGASSPDPSTGPAEVQTTGSIVTSP